MTHGAQAAHTWWRFRLSIDSKEGFRARNGKALQHVHTCSRSSSCHQYTYAPPCQCILPVHVTSACCQRASTPACLSTGCPVGCMLQADTRLSLPVPLSPCPMHCTQSPRGPERRQCLTLPLLVHCMALHRICIRTLRPGWPLQRPLTATHLLSLSGCTNGCSGCPRVSPLFGVASALLVPVFIRLLRVPDAPLALG